MSDSEAMDTTPVGEDLDSTATEQATPDTSEQATPDTSTVEETPTTQKRWNLRQRKPVDTTPQTSTKAKPAAKKSQAADTTLNTSDSMSVDESPDKTPRVKAKRRAPKTKTPATKRRSKPAADNSTMKKSIQINSESMFTAVSQGKSAIKTVASDWVDRYEFDSELAMMELVMFIVRCCGGITTVPSISISDDLTEAIRSITENFQERSHEYPLNTGGPLQKKFKNNFCELIWRLVEQCQHGVLFDGFMLDTFVLWLVGLSDSQVRAFRHTASLAGVKLLSGIIEVANKLNTEVDNAQRQLDAERKKQQSKKTEAGLNKVQTLLDKQKQLQEQIGELEEVMKTLFSSIFVHRYRDKKSEIRALCITELGEWLHSYSGQYLHDSYLKYVGWMLYDKSADVRMACLNVLGSMYGDPEIAPLMGLFTGRFKDRLVTMRLDVDDNVAVEAITVLEHMQKIKLLEMEDCQEVCELVFLESKGISHAAGRFTISYLFSEDFMSSRTKLKKPPKGCKKATDEQIMLYELIKFFMEVRIHQHASYFVDSIWEHTEVLQEWKSMTDLLLDDKRAIKLCGEEEETLIEMMTASILKATGTTPPSGRNKGRVTSLKERKAYDESKANISNHFMEVLPELMEKFGSSPDSSANLASIPQHIDPELYAENRLQIQMDALIEKLHHLMMRHHADSVFRECALTYEFLSKPDFSFHINADIAFKRVLEEMVEAFNTGFNVREDMVMGDEEDEECIAMIVNTQRLASVFGIHDIRSVGFCENMSTLLAEGPKKDYSGKILMNALACLKGEIMWSIQDLEETDNYDKEALRDILVKRKKLFSSCENLIKFSTGPARREAFVTLSDMFTVFSKHLHTTNPSLESLALEAPPHLQDTLNDFIRHHVLFCEDDDVEPTSEEEALEQAEKLNDRRVLLAGYIKMAMFGAVDMDRLGVVWAEYVNQYTSFGDLIKYSMSKCREHNPAAWARTAVLALQSVYTSYREESGAIDQQSVEWAAIKDLARKYALSLGIEHHKARLPLFTLHREGIQFALWEVNPNMTVEELQGMGAPPSLEFFSILNEFTYRLLAVDRTGDKGIVAFLKEQLPPNTLEALENNKLPGWKPLLHYYNSVTLVPGKGGRVGGGAVAAPQTIQSNQARARKRPLKINDLSLLSESSVSRPSKLSRIEGTPLSVLDSEESADWTESSTPTPRAQRSRRNVPES